MNFKSKMCQPEEAEMWSVYIHYPEEGTHCIADCDTAETAAALVDLIDIAGLMFVIQER